MTAVDADAVAAAVARTQERIASAGGDPDRVRLVAVTKGHPAAAVRAALASGVADVGESYAQELLAKATELEDETDPAVGPGGRLRWHWIGRLQRNKVRQVASLVGLWQSIDRLSVAGEVARQAPGAAVLVQVNVSGVEQQGGCAPAMAPAVVEGCRDLGLDVRGLMAIGPQAAPDEVRRAFRSVRELADRLDLEERSMGMSGDLEVAVAEGSTIVRVGSSLFGPRGGPAAVGK